MQCILSKTLIAIVLFVSVSACGQNPTYNLDTEYKISQVENNLGGWVQLEGSSGNTWNLQERMKYYKVKGLSIAVINNYKLEWARGYGWADTATKTLVTIQTLF